VNEETTRSETGGGYEIRLKGHLHTRWSAWFDGMTVTTESDGTTVLRGDVIDQSALHGLLRKLQDLGLPLLSITSLPPEHPEVPTSDIA
jgi:hypothetical protein